MNRSAPTPPEGRRRSDLGERSDFRRVEAENPSFSRDHEFQQMADSMPHLAWIADSTGWIYWYNKRWYEYTGAAPRQMQGWGWRAVHHPDHLDRVVDGISRAFVSGRPWEDTFPLRGRHGEWRWFLSRAAPIRDGRGRVTRWFGTNTDVTETLEAQHAQKRLVDELNHRVKNTLATVQSLARQTFAAEADPDAFRRDFEGRLVALSQAHDLLTRRQWTRAPLIEVLSLSAAPVRDRMEIVPPSPGGVTLNPKQALSLAMAMHELTVNAVEHGALSRPEGRVRLEAALRDDGDGAGRRLWLEWRESGGPILAEQTRRGFGTRLLERGLAGELGGRVETAFPADGFRCVIDFPLKD